jgi:uncharacterized protein
VTIVAQSPSTRPGNVLAKATTALPSETGLVWLALALIAFHFVEDNFLLPQPGTSPSDHLASGLLPLAVLAGAAAIYPRLRAGARAVTAMTLGAIGITVGVPGAYYIMDGSSSGEHYGAPLMILAGTVLLASGMVTLWKARRSGGSRWRRYLRRALTVGAAVLLLWLVVFPIGLAYIYTHTGKGAVTPELGVPYENVTVTTSDSLELAAAYVPSKNRAAIVLFPGATRPEQARMLIRHGYGVLLLDPRGQGSSEGDIVRWAGDRDLLAGAEYLRSRTDVDPNRIGGFGFSVGGEALLEAAAQSTHFKAVVSEGAGSRMGDEEASGLAALTAPLLLNTLTAAIAVFSNHSPPPPIVDRIGRIAPRSVMLIYADPGMGDESTRQPKYHAAAGEPKTIWKVPGSEHTGGIDARSVEYERRVIAFFDHALLTNRERRAHGPTEGEKP